MPSLTQVSGRYNPLALVEPVTASWPSGGTKTEVAKAADEVFGNHKRVAAALAAPADPNPNAYRRVALAYSQG